MFSIEEERILRDKSYELAEDLHDKLRDEVIDVMFELDLVAETDEKCMAGVDKVLCYIGQELFRLAKNNIK
jgi:hypothetical protein